MTKPDIQSLKKWRDSLEIQKNELTKAIKECDRQMQYFNGEQTAMALEPKTPVYDWNNFSVVTWDILRNNIGVAFPKAEIMKQLEIKGFPIRDRRFIFAFSGYLGSLVKSGKIENIGDGVFVFRGTKT